MPDDIEKKVVFAVMPAGPGRPITLSLGMPQASYDYLRDGRGLCHDFDLSRAGLPLKVIIFGGKDHDAVLKTLQRGASAGGITINDQRNRDFKIKPDPNNFPDLATEAADLLAEIRYLAVNKAMLERMDSIATRINSLRKETNAPSRDGNPVRG